MVLARVRFALAALCMTLLAASTASAQVFGTFSWQMQPYCNIVTLTITQIPGGYTIDGNDNQCGVGGKLAGAVGMALLNPDGTVGLEFTIVTAPSGKAVHVSASINPANGSGPWTDSVGNTGNFALGSPGSGSPRPFPASGVGPATITATEIAAAAIGASEIVDGAVGAADVDSAQVQLRVAGTCTSGQVMIGVNANGTVVCTGVAQSGQVMSGSLSTLHPANASFILVNGSYPVPLPVGTATPTLEFRPGATTSATCPGIGQATAGRLCVYGYNTSNIASVSFGGSVSGASPRFGFSLDVFPTTVASEGFILANWAYRVP